LVTIAGEPAGRTHAREEQIAAAGRRRLMSLDGTGRSGSAAKKAGKDACATQSGF
jgi:hypothetical protein